ncbi:hypothetical protein, partial [Campylobacter fetus]|uniref:hypothetical protein n=1 Tax=Campylobacter fetus TaxID=196 RepID=UPI00112FA795
MTKFKKLIPYVLITLLVIIANLYATTSLNYKFYQSIQIFNWCFILFGFTMTFLLYVFIVLDKIFQSKYITITKLKNFFTIIQGNFIGKTFFAWFIGMALFSIFHVLNINTKIITPYIIDNDKILLENCNIHLFAGRADRNEARIEAVKQGL